MVFLRLQPYKQTTVASKGNRKLSICFFGPYKIIQWIGQVAYKLELPTDLKLNHDFHVSCLKKKLRKFNHSYHQARATKKDGQLQLKPMSILDRRVI